MSSPDSSTCLPISLVGHLIGMALRYNNTIRKRSVVDYVKHRSLYGKPSIQYSSLANLSLLTLSDELLVLIIERGTLPATSISFSHVVACIDALRTYSRSTTTVRSASQFDRTSSYLPFSPSCLPQYWTTSPPGTYTHSSGGASRSSGNTRRHTLIWPGLLRPGEGPLDR